MLPFLQHRNMFIRKLYYLALLSLIIHLVVFFLVVEIEPLKKFVLFFFFLKFFCWIYLIIYSFLACKNVLLTAPLEIVTGLGISLCIVY